MNTGNGFEQGVTQKSKKGKGPLFWVIVVIGGFVLVSCVFSLALVGGSLLFGEKGAKPLEIQTEQAEIVLPTDTLASTEAPQATEIISPTETIPPTVAVQTSTPMSPISLSGNGDDVVDFEINNIPAILHITYQTPNSNFAVIAKGEDEDLLVNTIGAYEGYRPINFLGKNAKRLTITASGEWTITISSTTSAHQVGVPGTISGSGDDVIRILSSNGISPDLAKISGQAEGNFAIRSYGEEWDLLVNEIGPYDGTVEITPDTVFLEVISDGPWNIEITGR